MTKAGYTIKIEVTIEKMRILEIGTMLEMTGIEVNMIEVIEETLSTELSYDRGRSKGRENRTRFSRNRRDSRSRNICGLTSMDKSEGRRYHYYREPGHRGMSEKEKVSR